MSRIGNSPITLPDGVTVTAREGGIDVKGPKGALFEALPSEITMEAADGRVRFSRPDEKKDTKALHGLTRALVQNMVTGVSEGFARDLEIIGVGYRAAVAGTTLNLVLGFSHPVAMPIPEGLSVKVEENTKLRIEGSDKEIVGQFAAEIRKLRPPEPYKGKGIRYVDEQVRRKVGKASVG